MAFSDSVKDGIEIVKLNKKVIIKVSKDANAIGVGIGIVALSGVALAIGSLDPFSVFILPISAIVVSFIGIGIFHLLATLFGGTGNFIDFYKAASHGYVIHWISAIPIIGPILNFFASLWMLVMYVVIIENVYKLTRGKAIVVVLIPIIILMIIGIILALLLVTVLASFASGFFGGMFGQWISTQPVA